MAVGVAEGPDKARDAIHQALHHPLLEIDSLEYANGALVHFTGGEDLTLFEVSEAVDELRASLSPDTEIILGATTEPSMEGRTQVDPDRDRGRRPPDGRPPSSVRRRRRRWPLHPPGG